MVDVEEILNFEDLKAGCLIESSLFSGIIKKVDFLVVCPKIRFWVSYLCK